MSQQGDLLGRDKEMGMDQVITVQRSVDTEEMYKLIGMENLWNLGHRFASVEVTVQQWRREAEIHEWLETNCYMDDAGHCDIPREKLVELTNLFLQMRNDGTGALWQENKSELTVRDDESKTTYLVQKVRELNALLDLDEEYYYYHCWW